MDNWPEPGNLSAQAPVADEPKPLATFYAVRHPDGKQYYRTRLHNQAAGWKPNLEDARLWTKLGTARSNITALSRPGFVPDLVEFVVTEVRVVDQKERVAKAKAERDRKEAERVAAEKKWRLEQAERELAAAQRRVEKLRSK